MKFRHPIFIKAAAFASAGLLRLWRRTIDWRALYTDPTIDPVHPHHSGRYIYVCWHEYLVMPIVLRGSRRMLALASEHRDGELISRTMQHLGWSMVRGSTTRGGTAALMRLLREDSRHLNITPDGPRAAARAGRRCDLSGIASGFARGLRGVRVRQAVARPGAGISSRCRGHSAAPGPSLGALRVPTNLGRTDLERYRLWFEKQMNWLTAEAEAWAAEGRSRPGEVIMLPRYTPPRMYAPPIASAPPLPANLTAEWDLLRSGKTPAAA